MSAVHPSNPGAGDGIITKVEHPVPHPMLENRKAKFRVFIDDTIVDEDD
jgi:hypothetical protein